MITLTEIRNQVLSETGYFLQSQNLELNLDNFRQLVASTLGVYNKYKPIVREFNITITGLSYDFTNHEYGVPRWVPRAVMVNIPYNIFPYYNMNTNLEAPREAPITYRPPVLYVTLSGDYDITAIYDHKLEYNDQLGEYYIETLSSEDFLFFKLLEGKFLQSLGRSRRSVVLNDLPVTLDASDLVSEGKELEQEALEELGEQSKWYLAWG